MNSKFFVPFETAKLLKEKGYPQAYVDMYYNQSTNELLFRDGTPDKIVVGLTDRDDKYYVYYTAAPTYHEVVDWLEGKGIILQCYSPILKQKLGQYTAGVFNSNTNNWGICRAVYSTREEALNAAILKALEMI